MVEKKNYTMWNEMDAINISATKQKRKRPKYKCLNWNHQESNLKDRKINYLTKIKILEKLQKKFKTKKNYKNKRIY